MAKKNQEDPLAGLEKAEPNLFALAAEEENDMSDMGMTMKRG